MVEVTVYDFFAALHTYAIVRCPEIDVTLSDFRSCPTYNNKRCTCGKIIAIIITHRSQTVLKDWIFAFVFQLAFYHTNTSIG